MVTGSEPDLIIKSARKFMSAIKDCETGSKLWKIYPTKTFKQLQQSMDKLTKYGKLYFPIAWEYFNTIYCKTNFEGA